MLSHVVVFAWKPGTTKTQIDAVNRAFARIASESDDVLELRHGPDLQLRDTNGDYALVATFADEAAWRRYQADPAHLSLVHDLIAPIRSQAVSIQFGWPELGL
jgi:hypothetical protein